ncbi:MAG: tungstate ABC transporter substrate-binding protein WtpA [Bacteroidetes bacterium]|nr:tungstate ABC transporter substrate-binding protein WtpA [Bacteroidota bacterium]
MKKTKQLISILLVLTLSFSCNNTNKQKKQDDNTISGKLIIFHAGSLSVPFKQITEEFNKEYPNVKIILEPAGSRKCARKITDLNRDCDIMASADYKVIDNLLIPDYADWNIKFASNEMSIVYNEKSHYANEINKNNWYNILLKKDVAFGRSDPNSDPCGYRAVLTSKLAEKYYNQNGIVKKILAKDLNYMRPKEVDLISLLEANAIDYIFLYRSVAEQHNLKFLILPDSVNLKNPELGEYYSTVSVEVNGKKPGEKIAHKGEPMVYGVTILKNAKNKPAAEAFTKFLLSKNKGAKIMEQNGQPSVIPSNTISYSKIPDKFKQFVKK